MKKTIPLPNLLLFSIIVLLALFSFIAFVHVPTSRDNTIETPNVEQSAIIWSQLRLDGKRIGCFAAYGNDDPYTKYPTIISSLIARGANVTQIKQAQCPITAGFLSHYDILWIDGMNQNQSIPAVELTVITTWVNTNYGRFLATSGDSSSGVHDVMNAFSLDLWLLGGSSETTTNIHSYEITQGVTSVYYDTSYLLNNGGAATLCVESNSFGREIVATKVSGNGRIVMMVQGITSNLPSANNFLLINNTFGWLGYVSKSPPTITSGITSPASDNQNRLFNLSVQYADPDNNQPSYINITVNGSTAAMLKANPGDFNYTDGCTYYFTRYLQPGTHSFQVTASDGTFTTTSAVFSGPTVTYSSSVSPTFLIPSVTPAIENNGTSFQFSVRVVDTDNNYPRFVTVLVNGTSYGMSQVNPLDFNVMDGKDYAVSLNLVFGIYQYQFNCSDGTFTSTSGIYSGPTVNPFFNRNLYSGTPTYLPQGSLFTGNANFSWTSIQKMFGPVNFTWQLSDVSNFAFFLDSRTLIPQVTGRTSIIVNLEHPTGTYYWRVRPTSTIFNGNWSDTQSFILVLNHNAPTLSGDQVTPPTGNQSQLYTFSVIYTDADDNPPYCVNAWINGIPNTMQKQDAGDITYIDGCIFTYSTYFTPGSINYFFNCSDGEYGSSTISTILSVSASNLHAPRLVNPTFSPSIGNNVTTYVFNVTYFDTDNNFPSAINVTINGTTHAMSPVSAQDINVMDGKIYTCSTSLTALGWYSYTVQCWDGLHNNSTGPFPGPAVNPFAPRFSVRRVAIFQDANPYGVTIISTLLTSAGIPYTIFKGTSLGKVSLASYDKVIISSQQSSNFYGNLTTPQVRGWLESFAYAGGTVEIHAANSVAINGLPGGYNAIYYSTNYLTINATSASHPILSGVSDAGLDSWSMSGYTYIANVKTGDKVLVQDTSAYRPRLVVSRYGLGMIIITGMAIEYAAQYSIGSGRTLLSNMLSYHDSWGYSAMLLTPSNVLTTFNGNIQFNWSRLPYMVSSTSFTWQVSNTSGFAFIVDQVTGIPGSAPEATPVILINYSTGIYYWRVRPVYGVFLGNWSEARIIILTHDDKAPALTVGHVTPPTGDQLATFNFTVIYTDADDNPPLSINVTIDGTPHAMTKAIPADTRYTDGCIYNYTTMLPTATHPYSFACSSGRYSNATTAASLIVTASNTQVPWLSNPAFSPNTGDNWTYFNFTVRYFDTDNNLPSAINVTINGTTYTMVQASAADTNVMDGKLYYANMSLPVYGTYQYRVRAWDGLYSNATALLAGPALNPFNGYGPIGTVHRVAIFKDSNPYGGTPEETVLTVNGISYTIYSSDSLGSLDLSVFDKVIIAGDQSSHFYGSHLNQAATRIWLEAYMYNGGVVVFAGMGINGATITLPFGFAVTTTGVTINALKKNGTTPNHPIIAGINMADFTGYTPIAIHSITGTKAGDYVLVYDSVNGQVRLVAASRGLGLMIISDVTAELAYINGKNTNLLRNLILYTREGSRLISPSNNTYNQYSGYFNFTWAPIRFGFGLVTYSWQISTSLTFSSITDSRINLAAGSSDMGVYTLMNYTTDYYYWRVRPNYLVSGMNYTGSWTYPFMVEIEKNNFPVLLENLTVTPSTGDPTILFTFKVLFTDKDNVAPNYVWIYLDGSPFWMNKNASDNNFADGMIYTYSQRFNIGFHSYYVATSDWRFSNVTTTRTLQIFPNNYAPTLTFGQVSPSYGNASTQFNFTVLYTDQDNNAPFEASLILNGTTYAMVKASSGDNTYTDGCLYTRKMTLVLGTWVYSFRFNDSHNLVASGSGQLTVQSNLAAPTLSLGQVLPSTGNVYTNFNFSVRYIDADNNAPVTQYLYVNGTPYLMSKAITSDSNYMDGCVYYIKTMLATGTYVYYFTFFDGIFTVSTSTSFLPVLTNGFAPSLSMMQVSPAYGNSSIPFNFTVIYSDQDNNPPVEASLLLNGTAFTMSKANAGDTNFVDGCLYTRQMTIAIGTWTYGFRFNDSHFLVSSTTGQLIVAINNFAPTLSNWQVSPPTGDTLTAFNFSVRYADADNNAPSTRCLYVNGTQYTLNKAVPSDTNYMDGCVYYIQMTRGVGIHVFYFEFNDGMYFATSPTSSLTVIPPNAPPQLAGAQVSPETGGIGTVYNFTVFYSDAENEMPIYIRVAINGTVHAMVPANAADLNVIDGKEYYFNTTLAYGHYTCRFSTSDGHTTVTSNFIIAPFVDPFYGLPLIFLLSPKFGDMFKKGEVTFTWQSLSPGIGSITYTLQISTDAGFGTVALSQPLIPEGVGNTSVKLDLNLPATQYYWRVMPVYQGIVGSSSAASMFIIEPTPFLEEYGMIIIIIGVIGTVIAVSGVAIAAKRSKAKKKPASVPVKKKMQDSLTPVGKKAIPEKYKKSEEVVAPKTEQELEELRKTESEVTAKMDVKLCIVHKGPIKGASYACPQCSTFYCLGCAATLSRNGEGCWSCGHKIELDETLAEAGTKQAMLPEKMQFYCSHCMQYHELESVNLETWVNCPICNDQMVYVKPCIFCSQPIALTKELYATYKGKLMQCPNCNKNVKI